MSQASDVLVVNNLSLVTKWLPNQKLNSNPCDVLAATRSTNSPFCRDEIIVEGRYLDLGLVLAVWQYAALPATTGLEALCGSLLSPLVTSPHHLPTEAL